MQDQNTLIAYATQIIDIEEESLLEDRILVAPLHKHAISQIYKTLFNSQQPMDKLKDRWDEDFGIIDDMDWGKHVNT